MSPRSAAKAPRRAPLSRAAVVDAAVALVLEEGASALGINRVARALRIRPPSLYDHVASGDDLKRAVVIEGWRRLGDRFAELEGAPAEADPKATLAAIAERFRDFVLEGPALYQLMSQTPIAQGDAEFAGVQAAILGTFARALAPLGLTGDDVIHATRALRAATHGFVLLEATGQFALAQDPAESYRRLVGWLVAGLGAETGDAAS